MRRPSYDPSRDLTGIILKLMAMDEKLNRILVLLEEEGDEEEQD